ncbi:MAG: YeeE/YedE thiosulfate transporter family protein [Rhodobacteraceae bacterium]|nr:YeeE/YedE thiosulfate transporter family protein [Paracoccaceae bacterium]
MRILIAALAGGLFGAGLMLSGMTDTEKVRGFLDVFGAWDPTLMFVMAGAIAPMAIAWWWAATGTPLLGGRFPDRAAPEISRSLVLGSALFGIGWGLAGLCPGPALAALGFGGPGVWIFGIAMAVGMWIAPHLRGRLDAPA